jgi:tRNA(fMet)-specific endonuclease VapC
LDTSVLVALLRGEQAAVRRLGEEAERGGTVSTTAVNLCELFAGAYASRDPPKEVGRIRRLVSSLDLLEFDIEAASRYGELVNDPALRRSPIGDFDLIIACIALSHEESVATRNLAHFERVPGLGAESW